MQEKNNEVTLFTTPLPRYAVLPKWKSYSTPPHPAFGHPLPQGARRNWQCALSIPQGGQATARGFTLIELLVVVLIIGILAAVAVPQYRFATDKARLMPYVQKVSDILKAEQVYYLTNGAYTPDLTTLDIDMTKICDTFGGGYNNAIYNCPGGIGMGIGKNDQVVQLYYCAEKSARCSSSDETKRYLTLRWQLTGKFVYCLDYDTARGKKLCDYFTQQFSAN